MSHASKQPSMLTKQVITDGLSYILRGGLSLQDSHRPQDKHAIPANFVGLCVATNHDPLTDDYVLSAIQTLGISRVRLDIGQDEHYSDQVRLLATLSHAGIQVDVHLVQPFAVASKMHELQAQTEWRLFVAAFLEGFGATIASLEIGSTINRKRWAGYQPAGFIETWRIAHALARKHGVKLIGPNVQDFEPVYNVSILKQLRDMQLLPDMQSNNLFVERVIEPEQPDHRIFKYRWTRCLNFNLIKKARLLQKVGADHGVPHLVSPVAFWAIYRIQRFLPDGLEKQADYVSRYFTLLAASGALQQANWGAMICHREGLINDGLDDDQYPPLERVTYYKSADGVQATYQQHPSFHAFKQIAHWLNGATYIDAVATGKGLEIHRLEHHGKQVHIAWTVNGRCALLDAIYSAESLQAMQCQDRDGQPLNDPKLITESPLFLLWPLHTSVVLNTTRPVLTRTVIHAHMQNRVLIPVQAGRWQGMLVAENQAQADVLWAALHPERLQAPHKDGALRHARNAIWAIPDPRNDAHKVTVKQPVKMHIHKQWLDRFKSSKALRSWNGAMELMRRGIGTARPLAYFEMQGDQTLRKNYFICEYVQHDFAISQAFLALSQGAHAFQGILADDLYAAFAKFCLRMHGSGIYFRDFSGGNILVRKQDHQLEFILIDTGRLRAFPGATPYKYRIADLTRALNKLYWPGRERFMQHYLAGWGQAVPNTLFMHFHLYDFKVSLKRTIGRKGIKKLLRKIKSWQGS